MGDEASQRLIGVQRLLDGGVLSVIAYIPEEFDGQFELVMVDGVGSVGQIVGDAGQHVDVVVGDVDLQRAVGSRGADIVVGRQIRQVVIVFVGQIARQGSLGAEHAQSSVAAQEDRLVVQIAAQGVVRARTGHYPD